MRTTRLHELLDPETLSRGETLGLMARQIVEGYRVGEHRSPMQGFAIEFSQHREYTAGDDPRHLDWKMLGKTDRYYIKQYEQDTNYIGHLLVDGSESMDYGSGKITKAHYAKMLAACLAYLILQQRDSVALSIFDEEIAERVARTDAFTKITHIANRLAEFKPTRTTSLRNCLETYAQHLRQRGIVIIISDLLDDPQEFMQGLRRLTLSRSEVIVFQVLDHSEITFDFDGTVKFIGLENSGTIQTSPRDLRKSYKKAFEEHQQAIRRVCEQCSAHYVLADTSRPLAEVLTGYLAFRARC